MLSYEEFIASKSRAFQPAGFEVEESEINPIAFPHQRDIIRLACKVGKFCVWANLGLGKTIISLEWARLVCDRTSGNVLILTPLAVAKQFVREGEKFGIPCNLARSTKDIKPGINVCNYESMHKLDLSQFAGVVADEASCIKDDRSETFEQLIDSFRHVKYKLACSATPSPNDYMELGSQCEFLGIKTRREMLADFFNRDGSDTSKYVLMGHGKKKFWRWVATWAVACNFPNDINPDYSNNGYELPPLQTIVIPVDTPLPPKEGQLFFSSDGSLSDQRYINKLSLSDRVAAAARIVAEHPDDQFLIWTQTNAESAEVAAAIEGAVEVTGSDSSKYKEDAIEDFQQGKIRTLVSKFSIFGFGINLHNCHRMIVLDDFNSFEKIYQGTGRIYRFGQDKPVTRYFINHVANAVALQRFDRKQFQHSEMMREMIAAMRDRSMAMLQGLQRQEQEYKPMEVMPIPRWLKPVA